MLTRSRHEYASPTWDPNTATQMEHLERVHHFADTFVKSKSQTNLTYLIATPILVWPIQLRMVLK